MARASVATLPAAAMPSASTPASTRVTLRESRVRAVTPPPAVAVTATASAASFNPLQTLAVATDRLLTDTANWLAGFPPNPITDLLEGGLYLIRRTLFPSSVGVITTPIQVPLYFATINSDGAQKVGIYASLGGNATPQFFEFDTGGKGFYATYASADAEFSPWWGNAVTTSTTRITNVFDSGLTYTGFPATTTVSLFSAPGSPMPLVSTGRIDVAQIDSITDGSNDLWTPNGSTTPPVDNVFWGDFGAALDYAKNGIVNPLTQLVYACGVQPGFRVHIDEQNQTAWLQIGLTEADLQDTAAFFFPMVADPKAPEGATVPRSGLPFYSEQVFNAGINIFENVDPVIVDTGVGITTDTGASTTLHNTNLSPSADDYDGIIEWSDPQTKIKGTLDNGLRFFLSGTTTAGSDASFFDFRTNDRVNDGQVKVQNAGVNADTYYLNTGIALFYTYDVIYSLGTTAGGGTIGFVPRDN